jgi:pyruvate/2-oxoglutarate dehydrogenase complex dihydrolipoamide acyltransferase (E2) component
MEKDVPYHNIVLPQLHRKSDYARVVAWLKEEGDRVRRGESILMMETGKGIVELQAEVGGLLTNVIQRAGEWVPVRTRVGVIRVDLD